MYNWGGGVEKFRKSLQIQKRYYPSHKILFKFFLILIFFLKFLFKNSNTSHIYKSHIISYIL